MQLAIRSLVAARTLALVEGVPPLSLFVNLQLQLARWHWLPLARQRYLLNSAILLFYPISSIPNDFMLEFSL